MCDFRLIAEKEWIKIRLETLMQKLLTNKHFFFRQIVEESTFEHCLNQKKGPIHKLQSDTKNAKNRSFFIKLG